jgi:hypothetical protein
MVMAGGGGGGYSPPKLDTLQRKLERARDEEQERLNRDVDDLLRRELARYNDRDVERTRLRLDDIADAIDMDIERLLFGGSVAKHTYVDGLSDVDALAILDRDTTQGLSAQNVLEQLYLEIEANLPRHGIIDIRRGWLAVTMRYEDGSEIQVLPSVRVGDEIRIPTANGQGWKATNPQDFREGLTTLNQRLGHNLVPTIKLIKSLVSDLPEQQRLTGYHVESIAVDAAADYRGDPTPRVLLDHVLRHATTRVLTPIRDITGQSKYVDEYLGNKGSPERQLASQAIGGIQRRLRAATSIVQWRALFAFKTET